MKSRLKKRSWSVFPGPWTSHLTATKRISGSWSGWYVKKNRSDQRPCGDNFESRHYRVDGQALSSGPLVPDTHCPAINEERPFRMVGNDSVVLETKCTRLPFADEGAEVIAGTGATSR